MKTDGNRHIDVNDVARLAQLRLSEDEASLFQRQLNDIVGYVREIEQVDVEDVEPTAHAVPVQNVFRADECREGLQFVVIS